MTTKLVKLLDIARETRELGEEVIPLLTKMQLDRMSLDTIDTFKHLTIRLSELVEGIVLSDDVSINELAQNNYEFLDTVRAIIVRIQNCLEKGFSPIMNTEYLPLLLSRIDNLIVELNSPPFLQQRKRTDEFLQRDKSDEDFTESPKAKFINVQ